MRLLLGALCLSSCGPSAREVPTALKKQSVVGGQHETRYPAAGYMLLGEPLEGPYCTLTLLSPRVALTAAHCVHIWPDDTLEGEFYVKGPTYLAIGLGDAMSTAPTAVRRVWIHPGYDTLAKPFSFYHDVALLFLSEPVQLDAYPTIAPLPPGETPRSVGYGGTVSGGPGEHCKFRSQSSCTLAG